MAVDFDGTIVEDRYPNIGPANMNTIRYLKYLKSIGNKLILWTCRHGKDLEDAVAFCKSYGIYLDAINDNLPEIVEKYGNNSRKIFADYYIDDRAFIPAELHYNKVVEFERNMEFEKISSLR